MTMKRARSAETEAAIRRRELAVLQEEHHEVFWMGRDVDYERGRREGCRIMPLIFEDEE